MVPAHNNYSGHWIGDSLHIQHYAGVEQGDFRTGIGVFRELRYHHQSQIVTIENSQLLHYVSIHWRIVVSAVRACIFFLTKRRAFSFGCWRRICFAVYFPAVTVFYSRHYHPTKTFENKLI